MNQPSPDFVEAVQACMANSNPDPGQEGRPWVCLAYAQSLDGSITPTPGQPFAVSSAESLRATHYLRSLHQAILVGIGTVLADDPQLTVRLVAGESPQPVVLDRQLRFPLSVRMASNPKKPWVFTAQNAPEEKSRALQAAGFWVIRCPENLATPAGLAWMLDYLGKLGVKTLMVEGGGGVISSFLQANLVNWVALTLTPRFFGGYPAVQKYLGMETEAGWSFPTLVDPVAVPQGGDFWLIGRIKFP